MNEISKHSQKNIDNFFKVLPLDIQKLYSSISTKVKEFNTFDLLSNISFYNHLHDTENYTDHRGDKHFFVSEVIALICLKGGYIDNPTIRINNYQEKLKEIQDETLSYCAKKGLLDLKENRIKDNIVSEVSNLLTTEAKTIRNPGLPDHHLIFSEKLFSSVQDFVKERFGFSISESIKIRKSFSHFLNDKYSRAIDELKEKIKESLEEVNEFKSKKIINKKGNLPNSLLRKTELLNDDETEKILFSFYYDKLYFNFGKTIAFTSNELSEYSEVDFASTAAFLKKFSCTFPSLDENAEVYAPITILKTKPILMEGNKFLVPSFPLLTWAVEDVIEMEIKMDKKMNKKFPKIKHNFLLNEGILLFKKLLPTATFFPTNLFYKIGDNVYEADALIKYDRILFIVEAKGNRISSKAKGGHRLKTKDHLEDIIKDSYSQGLRTIKYLNENDIAKFYTKNGRKVKIKTGSFEEIIIVSLVLEPIGNLSMLIKTTNKLEYFKENHFPLVLSLYDLITIADMFENPLLFIHYLKRRKRFLSRDEMSVHEELDLVAYYMYNGLYIEHIVNDLDKNKMQYVQFAPNTDEINDYYMYKFGYKEEYTEKPKFFISDKLNKFLIDLDKSRLSQRTLMSQLLLEFNEKAIDDLMGWVKKNKKDFSKSGKNHDCSIYTRSRGGLGVTFMTGRNKLMLDKKLFMYCNYKLDQLQSNIWIGFGDMSSDEQQFDFKSMFVAIRDLKQYESFIRC
jgi:hypothetical protein